MMCYMDMTFCPFKECADFSKCDRALTDEVHAKAKAWMPDPPICQYMEKPDCIKEKKDE